MVVLIILLSILVVGALTVIAVLVNKNKTTSKTLGDKISFLDFQNKDLTDQNKDLVNKLSNVPVTIKDEILTKQVLEAKINELKETQNQLILSEEQKRQMLQNLDAMMLELTTKNEGLQVEQNNLIQSIKDARKIITDMEKNEFGYKLARADDKEKQLVLILEDIAEKYQFIAEDIRGISWKRVWLPKIQKVVKQCEAEKVMGIYKITIKKGDNAPLNYIGKATNIKDRWYNHLSKMCGKESCGNEDFYKYVTIKDLLNDEVEIYFTILEEVIDPALLDEIEKRWIGCLGDLNIKN